MTGPHESTVAAKRVIDLLRIHVVFDDRSVDGVRIAERISRHFDGIGMERDGVAHRVPVRFSSAAWDSSSPLPKAIDLDQAAHNAVVLLHDDDMDDHRGQWDDWTVDLRARMTRRGAADVYIPFGNPAGGKPLPADEAAHIQYARRKQWKQMADDEARDQRLLLLLLLTIRSHLRAFVGTVGKEPLFVSHAKADGDATAKAIVRFVDDPDDAVPLETFYDAKELMPGDDYEQRFKDEIGHGTLLAIVSDVYESRPWCVFELTEAKRRRRPIVLADVGGGRTSRTYPYGANLPRVRVRPELSGTAWIEPLLVETMSEGLRCDLFERQATLAAPAGALVLPRPPELFDVAHRDGPLPACIVYPDPPLGEIEDDLVRRALAALSPGTKLKTLGEIT